MDPTSVNLTRRIPYRETISLGIFGQSDLILYFRGESKFLLDDETLSFMLKINLKSNQNMA